MRNEQRFIIQFSIKLCSDKAAFEVLPLQKITFRMDDARRRLETAEGHEILVYTPHVMIFKSKGAEVTLSRDGRMLIKKTRDEKEATLIAKEALRIIFEGFLQD